MISDIKYIVVLMLENRGFDNMAGWIYADKQNKLNPGQVIPTGSRQSFSGLLNQNNQGYDDTKWCPSSTQTDAQKLYARYGTKAALTYNEFRVPPSDPHEEFNHMTAQLFGPEYLSKQPPTKTKPLMQGFAIDYETVFLEKNHGQEIMECYSPDQANVTAQLAKAFSISDAYFASCPTQTYPNRAFMAAGTSEGLVNNSTYNKNIPQAPTIFNVLYNAERAGGSDEDYSWGVYYSDYSITELKMGAINTIPESIRKRRFIKNLDNFYTTCSEGKLPAYSFLEPHYFPFTCNSNHPPFHINYGEQLLYQVYNSLIASPCWKDTLFIVNYDEHGGCYDHVPPPWGAISPDKDSDPSRYPDAQEFRFDRFGVRVPMLMISPWVKSGTVFRGQAKGPPLDHTSILATILDWKALSRATLHSKRIQAAQNLDYVLTGNGKTPAVKIQPAASTDQEHTLPGDLPLTSLQRGIVYSLAEQADGSNYAQQSFDEVRTLDQLHMFLNDLSKP